MKQIKKITFLIIFSLIISLTVPIYAPMIQNVQYAQAATVYINRKSATVYIKDTVQLQLLGTTKKVVWSSGNKNIASVSSKGKVTAINEGITKIIATLGTKQYTSTIEVKAKQLTPVDLYAKASKATVEIAANVSTQYYNLGSGFFIDNGILVTNFHVIDGANKIEVNTYDKKTYTVEQVLGYDKALDIAILKINSTNEYLKINDRGVTVGEKIYIIGSPLGLTGTFADGMVASNSRIVDAVDYIQVTAPMSQGNSGGPLLNEYGQVMGINTWQYVNGQNLNFSINIAEKDKVDITNPISVAEFYAKTVDYNANHEADGIYDSNLNWKNYYILKVTK